MKISSDPYDLGQAARHQRRLAARRRGRELDPRDLVGDPHFVEVGEQAVRALGHVLRRDGLGGLRPELGGLGAQRARLLFGVRPFATAALLVGGPRVEVALPAHVVDVDLAADGVEEPHPVHDVGEQVDVVADHDESAVVALQESAQPA